MVSNYQKPFIKTLSEKSISFNAFAASVVLVFNPNACNGPLGTIGTLEVENDQLEFCVPPGLEPSNGQIVTVQCQETGSDVFVVTLASVSCSLSSCDSTFDGDSLVNDSLCDITVDISSTPPPVCTVTSFASGGTDGCAP